MLRIQVNDRYIPELLLEISQPIIIRSRQRIRNRTEGVCGIAAWLPINRAQDTMSGNCLKSFEKAKGL